MYWEILQMVYAKFCCYKYSKNNVLCVIKIQTIPLKTPFKYEQC